MGKGLTILPKKLLYKCSLELNIQSLYNHRASNFEFVTASTIMAVIEINLIYMIYSLLKMHLFFLEILLGCQCTTHVSVLRPLQTGDQARYTCLSACQVSYLLRLSLNSEHFLYGASINEIKEGLLPSLIH